MAVALGTVDLAVELGLGELADGDELLDARSQVVLACSLAEIPAIDGPQLAIADPECLRAEAFAREHSASPGSFESIPVS